MNQVKKIQAAFIEAMTKLSSDMMLPPPPLRPSATAHVRKHTNPSREDDDPESSKRARLESFDLLNNNNNHDASAATAKEESMSDTHTIFAIDFSGSRNEKDVETKTPSGGRAKMTRWDAVFDCVNDLLKGQIQQNDGASECVVSLVIFNEKSTTLLQRVPLVGDGEEVFRAMRKAQEKRPCKGTFFSAGLREAERLASLAPNDNVMLVFLTDGRPGDLRTTPPELQKETQTSFRSHKKSYTAAGVHLDRMQKTHGDRLKLQFICLYEEGKPVSL